MEYFIIGLIKIIDNIIGTAKTITTYQGKKIITCLLTIVSQFIFYFVVKSVVADESLTTIIVVCICSGIGTYLAMFANDKFSKDSTYTNILTCKCNDDITPLCEYLLENKIKFIPVDSYNKENEKTRTVLAFATTRYESKLINQFLEKSDTKYLRQVLH